MEVSMISQITKTFITFSLFISFIAAPLCHATEPEKPSTTEESSAFSVGNMVNAAFTVTPLALNTYEYLQELSTGQQLEKFGKENISPKLEKYIRNCIQELNVANPDTIQIKVMADDRTELVWDNNKQEYCFVYPDLELSPKKKHFGTIVTNSILFIDEDIIDLERRPLLSDFLIKYALLDFKKNTYRNNVIAKVCLGLCNAAAFYKTVPCCSQLLNNVASSVGFTSLGDPQQSGWKVNTARFITYNLISPIITQTIIHNISSRAMHYYREVTKKEIDETIVPLENVMPLLLEWSIYMSASYQAGATLHDTMHPFDCTIYDVSTFEYFDNLLNFKTTSNPQILEIQYFKELVAFAKKKFFKESIIQWLDNEIAEQQDPLVKHILENIKKYTNS